MSAVVLEIQVASHACGVEVAAPHAVLRTDGPRQVVFAAQAGPRGLRGPAGEPGPAFDGTAWWYGAGPPGAVTGSKPGDFYLDTDTGVIYKLGD
jgi:hypothetical protein